MIFRLALLLLLLIVPADVRCEQPPPNTLTFGSIGDKPSKEIELFLPVAEYVADKVFGEAGIGRVKVAKSVKDMGKFMQDRSVDVYMDSPLTSIVVNKTSGGKMVLRRWKENKAEYTSIVFVRKDSGITSLKELNGGLIGFKDIYSSSGHIMPRIRMMEAGVDFSKTKYLFTQDKETNLFWVLKGRATAGTVSSEAFDKFLQKDKDQITVIDVSPPMTRHVVNLRHGLEKGLENRIIDALIEMESDNKGKEILRNFEKTSRFDLLPNDIIIGFDKIKKHLLSILENEL